MANQKIHEYPLERFVFGDDDYYDIDYWDGTNYQTAKILGSVIKSAMLSGIAISLTAPSAFIVGGSPTDGLGTLTLTAAGLANQYIRGDGTLATLPTSSGGGNSVNYYLNGGTAASVPTYYQMSKIPVIGTGVDFSLAGNGLISQWLTDLNDPNVTEIPAGNWNFEMFFSASSAGGVPKFYIEILKYDGTTFTTIADSSAAPESITSGTTIDLYLTTVAVPLTPLLVTDRLAIRVYIVDSTLGRTINQHTQDSHLCQIITTFSSGVSSINGLTKQTQYLTVGTAGTDFNIDSAIDTHTFNLPTASATKRGALSSSDWIAFNGKLSGLTIGTTPITSGTVGRVLFEGAGNVMQEDAGFLFDATAKTLTNYGKGAIATNTSFGSQIFENITTGFQNSAFGVRALQKITTSNNNVAFGYNSLLNHSTGDSNSAFGHGSLSASTSGISNSAFGASAGNTITSGYGNIVIGASSTTGITTGIFNTLLGCNITGLSTSLSNNVILTDGNGISGVALWKNSSNFVGIGYNPTTATLGAKLDIRAQGALSTDIAFRVRNSVDTGNIVSVAGNGNFSIGASATNWVSNTGGVAELTGTSSVRILGGGTTQDKSILIDSGEIWLRHSQVVHRIGGTSVLWKSTYNGNNSVFELIESTKQSNILVIGNGTGIVSNPTYVDAFQQYSADITAGNAAPHFRTENGSVIKLYKQNLATNPTNAEIATLLSNLGLANLI